MIQNDFLHCIVSFVFYYFGMISVLVVSLKFENKVWLEMLIFTRPSLTAIAFLLATNLQKHIALLFIFPDYRVCTFICNITSHSKLVDFFEENYPKILATELYFLTYISKKNSGSHQAGLENNFYRLLHCSNVIRIMVVTGIVLFSMMFCFGKNLLVTFDPMFAQDSCISPLLEHFFLFNGTRYRG